MKLRQYFAHQTLQAAVILLAVINACFFPFIWGNRSLLASARDASSILPRGPWAGKPVPDNFPKTLDEAAPSWQSEPWFALVGHEYFEEHVAPLWNPYQAYGAPLAANMQSQPFYPLTIAYSAHPSPRAYNIYILLRLFIAGFCAYLFLRFFISFLPAIAGGILSMLAGYYILFLTMPQLSVEVLLPASLLACETLARRPNFRAMSFWAAVIFLILAGGMPESSLLALSFACAYFAHRIATDRDLRLQWRPRVFYFVSGSVLGAALAAFFLLPFFEFLKQSFDVHQVANMGGRINGLLHDPLDASPFTYFFPLLFGPPNSSTLGPANIGLRNYFGVIAVFLILIAASRIRRKPTSFFLFFFIAIPLKRYGFPLLNAFGNLPFFRLVWFPKYEEAILSMCVAVLCAFALEALLRGEVSRRAQAIAFAATSLLIPLALLCSRRAIIRELLTIHVKPAIPIVALGLPFIFLLCLAVCLIFSTRRAILILLIVEFALIYIVPAYYVFNRSPLEASNPYAGAPFIDYLKKRDSSARIFFAGRILDPDWPSAFELSDIRGVDAMYYSKYFRFLHAFLPAPQSINDTELGDRFTGIGHYDFTDPRFRRLLDLSSVSYAGSTNNAPIPDSKSVYNGEIQLHELNRAIPRAAIYFNSDVEPNDEAVLHKLSDPSFDPHTTVVLNASQTAAPVHFPAPLQPAAIHSYRSQSVEIEASLPREGILVLNDSNYPGWTVTVDGRAAEWFPANYLFRGLLLAVGKHTVRFDYKPASFRVGAEISFVALLLLALGAVSAPDRIWKIYSARYRPQSSRPGAP